MAGHWEMMSAERMEVQKVERTVHLQVGM